LARLRIIFNYFNAASECRLFFFVPSLFFHSSRTKIWILNLALGFIRYEGSCGLFMGGFLSFLDVKSLYGMMMWLHCGHIQHIQDHISYCIISCLHITYRSTYHITYYDIRVSYQSMAYRDCFSLEHTTTRT
jgi:hypothetical protein